jgi:hypothetical protein
LLSDGSAAAETLGGICVHAGQQHEGGKYNTEEFHLTRTP